MSRSLMLSLPVALAAALPAFGQQTVRVPLNYNFNGIAHAGETNSPDASNGFRSISDRALDFTNGVPANPVFTRFDVVDQAGVLDIVHLGNRNTVDNGNWAFDPFPNGNDVGTRPAWLPNPDQSGPQATTLGTPIPLGLGSTATVLFHVSNGGGTCDVTFTYQSGNQSTWPITAPDWFGGTLPGRDSVDRANPGSNLNLVEAQIDLSSAAGETLTQVSFSNPSNPTAGYAIYALNVVEAPPPSPVQQLLLSCNWNGVVHSGEANDPDDLNGFRSIADRALDFQSGVPADPALAEFALVDQPGVLDVVALCNRDTVAGGTVAFDATADGDDIGVQPAWLPTVDLTGPQTTTLTAPVLLDGASRASFLYQMTNGGGSFDVTFQFSTGSVTATLHGGDWVGGSYAGCQNVDRALPGASLHIDRGDVDLGPLSGFVLTGVTFSNFSNPNGSCLVLAANVTGCRACASNGATQQFPGGDGLPVAPGSHTHIGCELEWNTTGATPSTPLAFWAIGFGAQAQPLQVAFPACGNTLHVPQPILEGTSVDAAGTTTYVLAVPGNPVLCGATVTAQFVELQNAPCPFVLGDALAITLGN